MVETSQARQEPSSVQLNSAIDQAVSNACMYGKGGKLLSKETQRSYAADVRHMRLYFGLKSFEFNSIGTDDFINYSKSMGYEPRSVRRKFIVLGKVRRLLQESGVPLADLSRAEVLRYAGKLPEIDTSCVSAGEFDDLIGSMDFKRYDSNAHYINLRDALAMTLIFHGGIGLEDIIKAEEGNLEVTSDGNEKIRVSYLCAQQGIGFRLPHEQYGWILKYFPRLSAFKKSMFSNDTHLLVNQSGRGFNQTRSLRRKLASHRIRAGLSQVTQRRLARAFSNKNISIQPN